MRSRGKLLGDIQNKDEVVKSRNILGYRKK